MQITMAAEALNTKLLQVLKLLTQGLAVTMLMAAGIAAVPGLAQAIFTGILGYIVIFIPLLLSLFLIVIYPFISKILRLKCKEIEKKKTN